MKQTALKWFLSQKMSLTLEDFDDIIEQALEMEKEQIEDAFNAGVNSEDFFYPCTGKLEYLALSMERR